MGVLFYKNSHTNISVLPETKERVLSLMNENETYDKFITKLLDFYEERVKDEKKTDI
jgi:hypothetical protein